MSGHQPSILQSPRAVMLHSDYRKQRIGPLGLSLDPLSRQAIAGVLLLLLALLAGWLLFRLSDPQPSLVLSVPLTLTPTPTATPNAAELVASFLVEADQAWQKADLEGAIMALDQARVLQADHQEVVQRLFVAHATLGLRLVEAGRLEEAVEHFDLALAFNPDDQTIREAKQLANDYLEAANSLAQRDWPQAIARLEEIYRVNMHYQQTRSMLSQAHYQYGLQLQGQGQLEKARAEYQRALELTPGDQLVETQLREVVYLLTPPTATPTATPEPTATPVIIAPEKSIVIDVSEQRLRAYEGGMLKWEFVCSTGRPGSDTRRGTFRVLDKIPNAWGGTWNIWMPYWLGIYWAGGTENGIHALPVTLDGTVVWANYLGRPISYGCIVLDTWAARQLYEWAEIGTPVLIRD